MRHTKLVAAILAVAGCQDLQPLGDWGVDAPSSGTYSDTFEGTFFGGSGTIAGGRACAFGTINQPDCATSDANGMYSITLEVAGGQRLYNTFSASGYIGGITEFLAPSRANALVWTEPSLWTDADATTRLATHGGFTYPSSTTGFVLIDALDPTGSAGIAATASIGGSDAAPVYLGSDELPDRAAIDMTYGGVFFGNLPAGTYPITIKAPGLTCFASYPAWDSTEGGTLDVVVIAGALNSASFVICE